MLDFFKKLFDRKLRVTAIIEMPQGTTKKIEIKDGEAIVDRELDIPIPVSYGFIPDTICEDGDALDIFVLSDKYLTTKDQVNATVIGVFVCIDQGVVDNKLLAITNDVEYNEIKYMSEVADYLLKYKPGFEVLYYKRGISSKFINQYKIK